MSLPWRPDPKDQGSLLLLVKAIPGASRTSAGGLRETAEGTALLVRIAAAPEKGKANEELVDWLARALGRTRSEVAVIGGQTARLKRLRLPAAAEAALRALIEG